MRKIKQATVIGAGVMGAAIAAHLANVGIRTRLLDIVPAELSPQDQARGLTLQDKAFRDKLSAAGLEQALKSRPASFYIPEDARLIQIGNIEDNLDVLAGSDWIIEAVVENLDLKNRLFQKIVPCLGPETILSSNTSGIGIASMSETLPEDVAGRFLGTHFFNPPRYMKLLEIIPGPRTDPRIVDFMADFCEGVLGKGVVFAKDTPNFIANRIGTYNAMNVIATMLEMGLTPEEVDRMTGPAIGHPKSATFRTTDLVGLDTLCHVALNVYDGVPGDECRDVFRIPRILQVMLDKKLLGDKTGSGFYKKIKTEAGTTILSLDLDTLEYREQQKVKFGSLNKVKTIDDPARRLRELFYGDDRACEFVFKTTADLLVYSANRIPEISDNIVNADNALKWGFAWEMGPFEAWDAIGLRESLPVMKAAGYAVPDWVKEMAAAGRTGFYKSENGLKFFYDPESRDYRPVETGAEIILLPSLKEREKVLKSNPDASLYDLGDGVACLEFHTKMNSLGPGIGQMLGQSLALVARDFEGMVIANHAPNFSVGANLLMLHMLALEKKYDEIDQMVRSFHDIMQAMKFFEKPVVAAPAGMALGGGCEICLHAGRVRAAAETYMGLVEAGVGLIPSAGGCKELLCRVTENLFEVPKGGIYPRQLELKPYVARAFETIALAKVSSSAKEARKMGLLRPSDKITINRDYLINDAKKTVLAMVLEGYTPPLPREDIRVMGKEGIAVLDYALYVMRQSRYISEYDGVVAGKLARVLCGGEVQADTLVSEAYILELERENFMSLIGNEKTMARIQHMLQTGKPLRN